MKEEIKTFVDSGANGFVFGVLNENDEIDVEKNKEMINIIRNSEYNVKNIKDSFDQNKKIYTTFHMAFDFIKEERKFDSIDTLIEIGFDRILTKGSNVSAIFGKENIRKYVLHANDRIIIMPGGGVTKDNYRELCNYTGCKETHGTKIVGLLN